MFVFGGFMFRFKVGSILVFKLIVSICIIVNGKGIKFLEKRKNVDGIVLGVLLLKIYVKNFLMF